MPASHESPTQPVSGTASRPWVSFSNSSLAIRLPLTIIVFMVLAFAIATLLNIQVSQQALINALKENLSAEISSQAELTRSHLTWTKNTAINLAAAAESNDFDEQEISATIRNTLARNPQVFGSTIAYEPYRFRPDLYYWSPYYSRTDSGELKFTQLGNEEYDYFTREWYTLPKANNAPVLSPPYFDDGGGEIWMVTWSVPFYTDSGEFMGVSTVDLAFSQTQELIRQIQVGQNGYAFLLDPHGVILGIGDNGGNYQPMEEQIWVDDTQPQAADWNALILDMTNGESGFVEVRDPRDRAMFVSYEPIGIDTGWSLGLAYPRAELFQPAAQLQNALIAIAAGVVIILGFVLFLFSRSITAPLQKLTGRARAISREQAILTGEQPSDSVYSQSTTELNELDHAFDSMTQRLISTLSSLEERVLERTRNLERRTLELGTISDVVREISIIRNMDTLLNVAVNLIRERFNFYHTGIYLVDERGEYANLQTASGASAQPMIEQGFKLKISEMATLGTALRAGQVYVSHDVKQDEVLGNNPFLPNTVSQVILPLRILNTTIGALDIHSDQATAFEERDISTLQLLADQLAAAIENARLVQQVEVTARELNKTNRTQTQKAWQEALDQRETSSYAYDGQQVRPVPQDLPDELMQELEIGKAVVLKNDPLHDDGNGQNTLLVPLMVLNQLIGVIGLEQQDPNRAWTKEEIAVAEAAANRAALTLENARLLAESQRRADKERTISESTARIGTALNIENILDITAEELERILGSTEVLLQINTELRPSLEE